MSILRPTVWLRDESASAYPATSPGYPGSLSVLLADLHQEQHGATTHRPRAQERAEPENVSSAGRPHGLGRGAPITRPGNRPEKNPADLNTNSKRRYAATTVTCEWRMRPIHQSTTTASFPHLFY